MIRVANYDDLAQIIAVHKSAFAGFFLTQLGPGFLKVFYTAYIEDPDGYIFVSEIEGEVVGVICGSTEPELFFSRIRRKKGALFLLKALPALLKHPGLVTRKLWGAISYRGDKVEAFTNATLISSIAVNPNAAGKGIGVSLVNRAVELAREEGAQRVYLTTDKIDNDRVIEFHKRGGFIPHSTFEQTGKRLMYRMVKEL